MIMLAIAAFFQRDQSPSFSKENPLNLGILNGKIENSDV
jgi:hypothetical protein